MTDMKKEKREVITRYVNSSERMPSSSGKLIFFDTSMYDGKPNIARVTRKEGKMICSVMKCLN